MIVRSVQRREGEDYTRIVAGRCGVGNERWERAADLQPPTEGIENAVLDDDAEDEAEIMVEEAADEVLERD